MRHGLRFFRKEQSPVSIVLRQLVGLLALEVQDELEGILSQKASRREGPD